MGHQYFQEFKINKNRSNLSINKNLLYNMMVLEIANNWEFVKALEEKRKNNTLKRVDQMQYDWISFIDKNKIDINLYKDSEDFVEKVIKKHKKEDKKE